MLNLTVKCKADFGLDTVIPCASVTYDAASQKVTLLGTDDPNGFVEIGRPEAGSIWIFVMNANGATVARYRLDAP